MVTDCHEEKSWKGNPLIYIYIMSCLDHTWHSLRNWVGMWTSHIPIQVKPQRKGKESGKRKLNKKRDDSSMASQGCEILGRPCIYFWSLSLWARKIEPLLYMVPKIMQAFSLIYVEIKVTSLYIYYPLKYRALFYEGNGFYTSSKQCIEYFLHIQ